MEKQLHHLVGMADICELLAAAFSFPGTSTLADGLTDGSFESDWSAAWKDATGEDFSWEIDAFEGFGDAEFGTLRKEYSRLYLYPGNKVPIWPYENCFIFRAKGREGVPSLFRSPALIDVENRMRKSGVLPVDYRTEPADTMFKEFAFLAYLYGKAAQACDEAMRGEGDVSAIADWQGQAVDFARAHALTWLPDFMDQTAELTRAVTYRSLATLGSAFMALLAQDAESLEKAEDC